MADLKTALEAHRPYGLDCKCGRPINSDADWAAHMDQVIAGLSGVAVTQLPKQPSEYWGPQHQPQWNHYPFTRVDGDEIEIGARCEHVFRVNVAEARIFAADILAATQVVEVAP